MEKHCIIIKILAIAMLTIAIVELPYDYYTILRWVICGISAYLAYKYYESRKNVWAWAFGIIALFFNPIFPVHLEKETWQIIDIGTAVIFFISLWIKHLKVN